MRDLHSVFSDDRSPGGVALDSNETSPPQTGERGRAVRERGPPLADEETEEGTAGVRCPRCGASNADEQPFTYCRNCLAQLR